ncbi:MAG TPA: vWA domain-containing protein [Candidatus Acidoferrales bacterium]|nr:vWA domain-containing protein [Candidatus Acidoferrales bacterium]
MRLTTNRRSARAQIFLLFALSLPVLILFVGLAVDLGFAFVTRANLSKAVDAAALAAMRNINQGQAQATAIAQSAFNTNYGSGIGRSLGPPSLNVVITTSANATSNAVVNVSATTSINTFFLGLVPGLKTLQIASSAQATRPNLIMSLVLDRSGSMNLNGGAQALPPAVDNFLTYFDNNTDQIADVSFSSVASVDVSIRTNFLNPITNAVNKMAFGGATYSQGGLLDGQAQINSVTVAPGTNVVKVAVFFTDGWANTVEDNLNCPPSTLLNFGGCAPPEAAVGWCSGISFLDPVTGNSRSCGATSFPSQMTGGSLALTQTNIANEAMYRAVQVANSMRSQGMVIYAIGLGDKISQAFLQQVANDPASSTFNPNTPVGEAVFAPTAADLQGVFQTIASEILLRLSR